MAGSNDDILYGDSGPRQVNTAVLNDLVELRILHALHQPESSNDRPGLSPDQVNATLISLGRYFDWSKRVTTAAFSRLEEKRLVQQEEKDHYTLTPMGLEIIELVSIEAAFIGS